VHEQVGYNLLYRAFVGLGVDEAVPDDTTLVRFRARVGEEGLRRVFAVVNAGWEAAGLIGKERRVLDGVHLWAKVARRSWVSLMRKGREVVVRAIAEVDPARAAALHGEYVPAPGEIEPRGEQALNEESERTARLLDAVKDIEDPAVRARVEQVKTLISGESDRVVSFDDPDARWGFKAADKPFLGYKSHEAIDPDSRIITAVDVVPGSANEAMRTDKLLEGETTTLAEGAVVIGDGLYNNARTVAQVEEADAQACFSGLKAPRVSDRFDYDVATDQMVCSQQKRSIGKARVKGGKAGSLYYFSTKDCSGCPLRETCLSPSEHKGKAQPRRRVYLSDVRKSKIVAGEAGKNWRKRHLKVRGYIEAKFDEQMNRHGLRWARYWGRAKVTMQVLLNVITVNAKRVVKLLKARQQPPALAGSPA
jgi:IS5 family transposase